MIAEQGHPHFHPHLDHKSGVDIPISRCIYNFNVLFGSSNRLVCSLLVYSYIPPSLQCLHLNPVTTKQPLVNDESMTRKRRKEKEDRRKVRNRKCRLVSREVARVEKHGNRKDVIAAVMLSGKSKSHE